MRNAAKFVFCALPGAFIVLVICPGLLSRSIPPPTALQIVTGIALLPIGAALILYGTNNWGRWWYVLPIFATLPFLYFWDGGASNGVLIVLLALPFVIARIVRKYNPRT